MPLDFERDDLIGALTEHGYRTDARTFFIWEGVTQYLTEDAVRATLGALQATARGAGWCSPMSARTSSTGENMYDAEMLYKRFRQRQQVWQFGLEPDEVAAFVAEYGWRLVEQAGPDYYLRNYIEPTGRDLTASHLEWSAYAGEGLTLSLDLDDRRHDHRLAPIGLAHPLADRAPYRLRDAGDIGDILGGKGFQLLPRPCARGLQRLRILGEPARMQMRRSRELARAAAHDDGHPDETRRQDEPFAEHRRRRRRR